MDQISQSPMYVAVVDDEVDLVYLFKDAVSQIDGIEVFAFSDPNLALEHFRLNPQNYRVVVSDYRMPGMNGIQMFEKMKVINSGVIRILISAFEIEDNVFRNCQCV
ncbi:MAG TPA: response regulator, partial [Nitrososphaeraceae archaeon]